MISIQTNTPSEQARRLRLKTQGQRLKQKAVEGAGLSGWEADVLVDVVEETFFSEPQDCPLKDGQMYYTCVAIGEPAGKPLAECKLQRVVLTLFCRDDQEDGLMADARALREHRLLRLTEEAREQGGWLTQEDLAQLLQCDVRTIRRHIQDLRQRQIVVPTRGQQQDIGPGVSHRGMAIRHWLEGAEPVEVARRIQHSLHAVERYLQHFSRVVFLARRRFHPLQIALTVGISTASVRTYLQIYQAYEHAEPFRRRWEEIDLIGAANFEAKDAEKGGPSRGENATIGGSKP